MDIKEAFSIAEILHNASPSTLADLASCGSLRRVGRGEQLFLDHEEVTTIYILVSGTASLYKCADGGEKRVIFAYNGGAALNEVILNGMPSSVCCEMLEDSYVLCFPVGRFASAMERDPRLSKAVMDSMSIKIRRLYRQLASGAMRGEKRLAAKLWKLSRDHGKDIPEGTLIDMPVTVTYLAEMLGEARETVSRQLRLLINEGLVINSGGRFIIPDRGALRKYFKSM